MRILATPALSVLMAGTLVMPAQAADNLKGEWENADGTFKLEAQGKGKCFFSAGPVTSPCTYKQEGRKTIVNIQGEDEPFVFVENDDGSLSSDSDPDALMAIRLKKK
jgi:hypothetical protein